MSAYGEMIPATNYAIGEPFPRPILAEHIAVDATLHADRQHLVADIWNGGRLAELGSYKGDFAEHILHACAPDELHLFDKNTIRIGKVREASNVYLHQGNSSAELARFPEAYFDGIYIDGDHSRKGVAADAFVARHKVRPGGVLIFNDYTLWSVIEQAPYGICHAVSSLCYEGFSIIGYAFQFQNYPDIALERPA